MVQSVPTAAVRQRLSTASPMTKFTVVYLLGQALYQAERGNDKRAIAYVVTALATLKFSSIWIAVEGLLYANKIRRRLMR